MKIIDLLNKIANGEEPPKKIRYQANSHKLDLFTYNEYTGDYSREIGMDLFVYLFSKTRITGFLNDEVEIIEEDKKIEKIIPTSLKGIDNLDEKIEIVHIDTISAIEKINEIIDYINKGDK